MNDLPSTIRVIRCREAAAVERCHTLPHVGTYSVGHHSHNALSLYLALHPSPRRATMIAIHTHDYGERWTGDVPSPAKWADDLFARRLRRIEGLCLDSLRFNGSLDPEEASWLRAVDALELWLWAQDQVALGNRNAEGVIRNLEAYFDRTPLPAEVEAFLADYEWTRTSDTIPR